MSQPGRLQLPRHAAQVGHPAPLQLRTQRRVVDAWIALQIQGAKFCASHPRRGNPLPPRLLRAEHQDAKFRRGLSGTWAWVVAESTHRTLF